MRGRAIAASPELLPLHGFVLAGGKGSRMGRDKALLPFLGRPMVEIAVEKLRSFCADVAISGNRDDLASFAPVVHELQVDSGPAAGVGAGLPAATRDWALFLPVDVPLLSADLLRRWTEAVLAREGQGLRLSYLRAAGQRHPAICLLHKDCLGVVSRCVEQGILKLGRIFEIVGEELGPSTAWLAEAEDFGVGPDRGETALGLQFSNVNTPQELAAAETLADGWQRGG